MTDTDPIHRHKKNIDRYCRILTTPLTNVEREYIHKRIAQERIELERLTSVATESADVNATWRHEPFLAMRAPSRRASAGTDR